MSFFDKLRKSSLKTLFKKVALTTCAVVALGNTNLFAQSSNIALKNSSRPVIGSKSMYVLANSTQKYIGKVRDDVTQKKVAQQKGKEEEINNVANTDKTSKIASKDKIRNTDIESVAPDPKIDYGLKKFPADFGALKYFGYDLFSKGLGQSVGKIDISNHYHVGPGDVFQVAVWGSEEASFTSMITPGGEFLMPGFGHVNVVGKSFAGFKKAVRRVIGKELSGFELAIVPVKPRKNNIFVVGEVNNPGVYGLEGAATTLSALFAAGGATKNGSLRKIEVKRGKKLIGTFDLYDLLTKGDRSKDLYLSDGDTVFVPLVGPRVEITGAVKRPAIYELKPGEMYLGKAIDISGGIIPTANLQKIQIKRTIAHGQQIVFSREVGRRNNQFIGNKTPVQDMDVVRVFSTSPRKKEMVTLEGHVFEPGPRPWKEGIMLSDILQDPDMLKKDPALNYGEILREGGMGGEYQVVSFNPGKILAGDKTADVELKPKDRIVIFPASLMYDEAKVSVSGAVVHPGSVNFTGGMRVKDLVYRCGGLKNGASLNSAELSRRTIVNGKLVLSRIEINLGLAMKDDPKQNITIKPFDCLVVRRVPQWKVNNFVDLSGEVKYPGIYSFQAGERLSSVIERAKGFTCLAYLKAAVFIRKSVKRAQRINQNKRIKMLQQEEALEVIKSGIKDSGGYARFVDRGYMEEQRKKFPCFNRPTYVGKGYIAEERRQLLALLKNTQPEGRVIIKLSELNKFKGSKYDILLEPGDQLYIPARPSSVMVTGAVYNSMGILWEANKSIRHYLNKVGGISKNGDIRNIYLIKADGTVSTRQTTSNFLDCKIVEPGDTIFVPTRIRMPKNNWKRTLDIVQTISGLALTVLAINKY